LSRDEYLLLENRVNWVGDEEGVDLDSLLYRNRDEVGTDTSLLTWFDFLVDSVGVDVAGSGVITGLDNYDMGLPGSGLLIWHVDESRYTSDMAGINNLTEARAVSLLEADGAVDLGFPTTALFGSPDQGWRWDLWYAGNEAYFMVNTDRKTDNPERLLALDAETYPALRLNRGAAPGVAISQIGPAGDTITFSVDMDAGDRMVEITQLPDSSRLLGYNGVTWIYGLRDSLWMGSQAIAALDYGDTFIVISEHDAPSQPDDGFWVLQLFETGYVASRYRRDGTREYLVGDSVYVYSPNFGEPFPFYDERKLTLWVNAGLVSPNTSRVWYLALPDTVELDPVEGVSIADIDGDGESDWLTASLQNQDGLLWAQSEEGTMLDGYPIDGDFQSVPLISNLMDDIRPEIVVVEDGAIAVYGPEGREKLRLGLRADPDDLFLMHTPDRRVGLANGDRIYWFEPGEQNPQWVTAQGRHSRSRYSLNDGQVKISQPTTLDKARVYNYPNPVTGGRTKIRFYTGQATRATIRIFTVEGLPVSDVTLTDLATNDYNEWVWQVGDNPSGLYYAVVEVEGSDTESALVKIAVVR
ncbi:MAG: T9SS type A sorting domain-containing protein, partial [Candidatus Neomarinimicrobiota bacterium]